MRRSADTNHTNAMESSLAETGQTSDEGRPLRRGRSLGRHETTGLSGKYDEVLYGVENTKTRCGVVMRNQNATLGTEESPQPDVIHPKHANQRHVEMEEEGPMGRVGRGGNGHTWRTSGAEEGMGAAAARGGRGAVTRDRVVRCDGGVTVGLMPSRWVEGDRGNA